MFYILSIFVGIFVIVSTILNGRVAEKIGMTQGMKLNYITGAIFSILLVILIEKPDYDFVNLAKGIHLYLISGFMGISSLYLLNRCVTKISAFNIVIFPFVGQIFTGLFLDYFILNIFSLGKLIGGFIIILGLIVYNGNKILKSS